MFNNDCSFTINGFCQAHHISRGLFYKLLAQGLAPKIIKIGRRTIISAEAVAEWRKQMEQKNLK